LNYNGGYCENPLIRNQENLLLTQQIRPQNKIIQSSIQPPWENITFKYNPLHQDIDTIEEKTEFGESQINMNMYRTNDFECINNKSSSNNQENIYLESIQNTLSNETKLEPAITITTGLELFDTAGVCYGNFLKTQRLPTQTIKAVQPIRKFQSPNPIVYKAKYKNFSLRNRPQTRVQTRLLQRPHTQQNYRNFYNSQQQQQQQTLLANKMNNQYKTNRRVLNQQQQQQFFEQQQKLIRTKKMYNRNNNLRNFNFIQKQNPNRKQINQNLNYCKKTLVRHKSKFKSVISKKLLKIKEKNNDIEYCFLNCCNFLQSKSRFKFKFLNKCPCGTSNMKPESYYDVSYAKQIDSTNDTDTNYDKQNEVTPSPSSSSTSSGE